MARARRDLRLFDSEGREVTVTLVCTSCHRSRPFAHFGIRRMADGKLRSIPQCRACRGGGAPRELVASEAR